MVVMPAACTAASSHCGILGSIGASPGAFMGMAASRTHYVVAKRHYSLCVKSHAWSGWTSALGLGRMAYLQAGTMPQARGLTCTMINPQITYRGMAHSPAFDDRIRELAGKLEEFNPKITSCHVIVDERDRHKHKGNHFEVRVDLHVPGKEIVASLKENEDPYIAL